MQSPPPPPARLLTLLDLELEGLISLQLVDGFVGVEVVGVPERLIVLLFVELDRDALDVVHVVFELLQHTFVALLDELERILRDLLRVELFALWARERVAPRVRGLLLLVFEPARGLGLQ